MASRSEAKSKDLKKFNIQLIHGILRHFVPQNDSALFVGRDFVDTLTGVLHNTRITRKGGARPS